MVRKNILLLIVLLFNISFGDSQNISFSKSRFCEEECLNNMKFDSIFNDALTKVKSAYPELKNISIIIRQKSIKTIMAARPAAWSFFNQRNRRQFQIILSSNQANTCKQLFTEMPEIALTGILGHEFAHLLSYHNKSSIRLAFYAISYLFNKKKIERETDLITIDHGFGKELLEYNMYILDSKLVSEKYLRNRNNNYLSINEIKRSLSQ